MSQKEKRRRAEQEGKEAYNNRMMMEGKKEASFYYPLEFLKNGFEFQVAHSLRHATFFIKLLFILTLHSVERNLNTIAKL